GTGLTVTSGGATITAGDLTLTAGNLITGTTQRLSNAGALGNITGYDQTSGGQTIALGAGNTAAYSTSGAVARSADMMTLQNTSATAPTADGVNAIQVTWFGKPTGTNQSSGARVNVTNANTAAGGQVQGFRIVATGAGGAINSDTVGLSIDPLTSASSGTANENAIEVGTGWDNILSYNGTTPIITGTGVLGNAALTGTYSNNLTLSGTVTISNAASTWNGGTIAVAKGGTGLTTLTQGGVIYASGTTAMAVTTAGTSGQCLASGGTGAPTWVTCSTTATGTANTIAMYTGANALGNSIITQSGTTVTVAGTLSANTALNSAAITGTTSVTTPSLLATGVLDINSSSAATTAITIGTTTGARTITIGNTTAASTVNITGGTGATAITLTGNVGIAANSNFTQAAGTGTFTTASGAVTLNGNVTVASGKTLTLTGIAQGGIAYGAASGVLSVTAAGTSGQCLASGGTAAPTWVTCSTTATGTANTIAMYTGAGALGNSIITQQGTSSVTVAGTAIATTVQAPTIQTAAATALSVEPGTTGALNLGNLTTTAINIGVSASVAKTITVGNSFGATSLIFNSGTAGATFNQLAGGTFNIASSGAAARTTDLAAISNVAGQEPTADGINALQLTWNTKPATGNTSSAQRINVLNNNTATAGQAQGLRIAATGAGGAVNSDTVGISIDNLANSSTGTASENAFEIGSGWDNLLVYSATNSVILNSTGILQSYALSGSYTNSLTLNNSGNSYAGTWAGNTIDVAHGGTGATTLTQNGVVFGNGTSAVGITAAGTTGQCLVGNTGAAPSFGSCSAGSITGSGTAGTLPVYTGSGTTLGDSILAQSGSVLTITGTASATSGYNVGASSVITSGRILQNIASVNQTLSGTVSNTYDLGTTGATWRTGYFGTSVVTPALNATSSGGTVTTNLGTLQRTAAGTTTLDLKDASATTLLVTNSGGSVANLSVSGDLLTGGNTRLTSAGVIQNITGYNQSSGSAIYTMGPANQYSVTTSGSAPRTASQWVITNTAATAPTGDAVDGLLFNWNTAPASGNNNGAITVNMLNGNSAAGGTASALRLTVNGPGTTIASDTNGLLIDSLFGSSTGATEDAIKVGSGWDNILATGATPIINGSGVLQSVGLSGTYSNALTLSGAVTMSNASSTYLGTWNGNTIAVNKGGTGLTSLTQGGVIYASGTTAMAVTTAGTSGQCLASGGTGAPTWVNCATTGTGTANTIAMYTAAGAIGNSIITQSGTTATVGGTLSASTAVTSPSVSGTTSVTTPSLTNSGAININSSAAGTTAITLGTATGARTITIGNTTAASTVTINAGTGAGAISLGGAISASGTYNTNTFSATALNFGGATGTVGVQTTNGGLTVGSNGTGVLTLNGGSGATGISASGNFVQSGSAQFTSGTGTVTLNGNVIVASGKTLTLTGATQGGIVYGGASGVLSVSAAGTSGQCLISGGTGAPTWTACATGITGSGTQYTLPVFNNAGGTTLGNSIYAQDSGATTATISGILTVTGNVGFGNLTPANLLSVNTPTTADANADVLIAASSLTQDALVIQWAPGAQTASSGKPFAIEDSTGTVKAGYNSFYQNLFSYNAFSVGSLGVPLSGAIVSLAGTSQDVVTTLVRGSNGQTADLMRLNVYGTSLSDPGTTVAKFDISGKLTANGASFGNDVAITGANDLTINTNKFTVAGATGNTVIAGTANITGNSAVAGTLRVGSAGTATYALDVINTQNTNYVARIQNTSTTANTSNGLLIQLMGRPNTGTATNNYLGFARNDGTVAGTVKTTNNLNVSFNTANADYAEYFRASPSDLPQAGDVVSLAAGGSDNTVVRSNGNTPVGVISTNPGFVGNGPICNPDDTNCDANYASYNVLVSLTGQVPVKVNVANGVIRSGDALASDNNGVATKATKASEIIGYALSATDSDGTVQVMINPGFWTPDPDNIQANSATLNALTVNGAMTADDINVGNLATIKTLTVTGDATIGGHLTVGNGLKVTGLAEVDDLQVNGHFITAGNAPTLQVLPAAGNSNSSVSVDGNDTAGTVTITTGDAADPTKPSVVAPTAGDMLHLTFSKAFGKRPRIVISPADGKSAPMLVYPTSQDATGFNFALTGTPAANTSYSFDYFIAQ
ncbi:MAG: hypothetical protein JWN38_1285, partial [Candidatus Saccharibacteria bacterium]|nr:hypothetical protein [Candidatus Saccharibacteria bacterium]